MTFGHPLFDMMKFPDKTGLYQPVYSSETVNFFLPLALLEANTFLPLAVDILSRKPCLFFLFLLEG